VITEPVFVNVKGAQESILKNRFLACKVYKYGLWLVHLLVDGIIGVTTSKGVKENCFNGSI
jgi:hypothetical protein